jgi:hypothetical protein
MKSLIQKIYSCEKEKIAMSLGNALLWAAVIIVASWLTRGSENADTLFVIILSVATTAFLFTDRQQKNR